jgi:DNA-binding MarR family transcriptional regulator
MEKFRDTKNAPHQGDAAVPESVQKSAVVLKHLITELGRSRPLRDPLLSATDVDLTPPQIHAIMWIGEEGAITSSTLAHRVGCTQPTVTGIVDRLEKLGLAERLRDENDRRVVRVRLTERGEQVRTTLDEIFTKKVEHVLEALTVEDRGHVLRILEKIVNHAREHALAEAASSSTGSTPPSISPSRSSTGSDPEEP